MRRLLSLLLLSGTALAQTAAPAPVAPPPTTTDGKQQLMWKLEAEIAQTGRELDGVLGVAITDLATGQQLLHNADQVFPTASVIKLAVLAELYRQHQQAYPAAACGASHFEFKGRASLCDHYRFRREDLVADSQIMAGLTPGYTRLTNRDLAQFVVAVSDNAATNVLIERVGMENVNALLDSLGLKQTRLRRKMMDLEAARQGRENVSTPRETAALLEAVYRGKVLNKELTADFLNLLTTAKESNIPRPLPEDVKVANKPGSLEGVRADCGVVFLPGRPFVLCVMTSYLQDERAGEAAITRISGAAYRTFDRLGRASPYGRIISPRNSGSPK